MVLREAMGVLRTGGIIAYPTETFYGLAARFDFEESLARLNKLKGRPEGKPMPLIAGGMDSLKAVVSSLNETEELLIRLFWPGPLTILLTSKKGLSKYITSRGKVAVRIPSEPFALKLVSALKIPITATSANPSGFAPAEDALKVKEYFGDKIDLIIDGGKTPGKAASTIVEASGKEIKLIREGPISYKSIKRALDSALKNAN